MHKIINKPIALIAIALLVSAPQAQQRIAPSIGADKNEDRVALHQALLDLTNPWTVMCVAAHPDDEDGTTLTVLRRKYGVHTVSLFSTFGEGGQNAIGPELYEELGVIRARETMAAAEVQGSEPHFLGLKDFGYSKSADETFQKWGHDEALRRMVLQIRKLRPDVIITNHSVTNNDHGHHQATARLVVEAFDAAADPKRFPEQLKDGVTVWQVQRLFVRASRNVATNTGQKPDREGGLVTIDPNERDPIRGTVYAEEALRALQKHATQGPWPRTVEEWARRRGLQTEPSQRDSAGAASVGIPLIRYHLIREAKGAAALPADSHYLLDGLRLPEEIAKQLTPPTIDGRPLTDFANQPERVLEVLADAKKKRRSSSDDQRTETFRLNRRQELIDRAIGSAAGLTITITPINPILTRNGKADFTVTISNKGNLSPWVIATHSDAGDSGKERFFEVHDKVPYQIEPGKSDTLKLTYHGSANAPVTVPHSEHLYDGLLFSQLAQMAVYLKINGVGFSLATTTWFDVAPEVEIADISPSPLVLTPGSINRQTISSGRLINHGNVPFKGTFYSGFSTKNLPALAVGSRTSITLAPGEHKEVNVSLPLIKNREAILRGNARLSFDQLIFFAAEPFKSISERTTLLTWSDARTASNLRVGYVRGFDYSLPNALAALGVESKELSIEDVRTGDLQKYSTMIIDNRVYESQPELIAANQRLLDYAKDGGTLIVFYHKSNEWNPDQRRNRPQLAPYKLILGDERITDENAPVSFIEPQHPLLNFPNKINQDDFAGWIQERGLYYPKEWDANYHALLQSNDPGDTPLKGGLLVADYGRGHYIYTSMVWYRQLRAGVPGAYRMFANMISYGHR